MEDWKGWVGLSTVPSFHPSIFPFFRLASHSLQNSASSSTSAQRLRCKLTLKPSSRSVSSASHCVAQTGAPFSMRDRGAPTAAAWRRLKNYARLWRLYFLRLELRQTLQTG